ncbi:MAG: precorrin-6A reductase [Clostridia bacterium]|nr:precorrin-6A reductase [Clostridia bacterium]
MSKICIFAGTKEGHELVNFLSGTSVNVTACVATEYGETLLSAADNLTVSAKRLNEEEMVNLFNTEKYDMVLDATHPYADIVTKNIKKACDETDTVYQRVLRSASEIANEDVYVADIASAVEFLNTTEGNILLTTGSKELMKYIELKDFTERAYARVLPMDASLVECEKAGLKPSHIIAMQGPFSYDMNLAMLKFINAAYLVTKDGGSTGGFAEKAAAAKAMGAKLVVIGRPMEETGLSLSEAIDMLCEKYSLTKTLEVSVVGLGPGSDAAMTEEVKAAIADADALIGAKRMLEAFSGKPVFDAIAPNAISDAIHNHKEYRKFTVVMSGDTGFFSGTKKLLPLLSDCKVKVLPGLSSLSYLSARLGINYDDVKLTSLHGRDTDIVPVVKANAKVFSLIGGQRGINEMCEKLTAAGLGNARVSIGERLSYPDERITTGLASELASGEYSPLCVAFIENDNPDAIVTHGLPDEVFQRKEEAGKVVPMTKSEVRSVCLSKLQLKKNSVCWDIGAGSGSVSIEMALQASEGEVYAIERNEDAVELLHENKAKLRANNMTIVSGLAPQACEDLPAPSHVFIGGSAGNMKEIISLILSKNPNARIVATAIALETTAELTNCLKEFNFKETEVVSMQVSRDRKAGPYHLMTAINPINIFTMQAGGK